MSVQPTGATHEVTAESLFFSTTDRKGVITQANGVFERLSRYPRSALLGMPHNIIRHPDMPAGAFYLTWEMLLADAPTCAYVTNLAADGSAYRAFATIVPVPGGFLSVRSRPCRKDLLAAAEQIYATVRGEEAEARAGGMSAHDTAKFGAQRIEQELAKLGFDSYLSFIIEALPAEVEARDKLSAGIPRRAADDADPLLADMLRSSLHLLDMARNLTEDLVAFQQQGETLSDQVLATEQMAGALDLALGNAADAAGQYAQRGPLLVSSVAALHAQFETALASLTTLRGHVDELVLSRSELRFAVALARLQAEVVGRFVVEMVTGAEDVELTGPAVSDLVRALERGLTMLRQDLAWNVDNAANMTQEVASARGAVASMRTMLVHWRLLVPRYGLSQEMSPHLPVLDARLDECITSLSSLASSAGDFVTSVVAFDFTALDYELASMLDAMEKFAAAHTGQPDPSPLSAA